MYSTVAVSGYRSLRDVLLPLGRLTVVTGANGTGKSSVYRALRLLAACGRGEVVGALAREGGLESALWAGPESLGQARRGHAVQGTGRKDRVAVRLGVGAAGPGGASYLVDLGIPVQGVVLDTDGARRPSAFLRSLSGRRWSERSIILLVMQSIDNSITLRRHPKLGVLMTAAGHGEPNPTYLPVANDAARRTAEMLDGDPWGAWNETLLDAPTTAHILGGCAIGSTPEVGVLDGYQRVYGYEGLSVADGSAISANLGVNPSLTITAMTERAMSLWPNKGEPDPRPSVGERYEKVDPVPPRAPAVPAHAPAALRLGDQPADADRASVVDLLG